MATTLFFTTSSSVAITPSVSSAWNAGSAPSGFVRRVMSETDSGSTTDQEFTGTTSLGDEICQIQYVSAKKLRAQTISGSYSDSTSQKVSATGATHHAMHMRVVKPDETSRGTLEDLTNNTQALSSSYSTESDSGTVSSVAAQEGDYLVIEFGYTVNNTASKTFGTRAGSGSLTLNNTILWLEAPANLVYPITAQTVMIDDPISTNTPTWTDNGGTFTFTVATGALPTGVSLNATTGVITGNPSVDGSFTFTIQVANSEGSTVSNSVTYTVEPLTVCTLKMNDMMSMKMEMG